jgi:hypothetical protein
MTKVLGNIKMDWSINISNLIALVVFILSAIGAWYDVKTDVRINRESAEMRFRTVESFITEQKRTDQLQDERTERQVIEIRSAIRESASDIKDEIRNNRSRANR